MHGPRLPFSEELHAQKYRQHGESFRDAMNRIASALSDDEDHFRKFRDILLDMRFMPAGRVQSAMGSTRVVTPYNCFVSGTIEDSFVEGNGSIMDRAKEAAATMRMGGGIGYDFSKLRPRGDLIRSQETQASGPVSFMNIFDAICQTIASAGHRRGAQMGVLRVDHPDIEEFVHAKHNETQLTGFNVSIAVTDAFMEAALNGRPFKLRWDGREYREIDAASLWETIMRSTWDWAEPGVLFVDTINRMNNLWYCEEIVATNPCGEQPLPPYGACLLGSFNIPRYLVRVGINRYEIDWDRLGSDVAVVVRAMDNVVDKAIYPLWEQKEEAKRKRRMGLGVTGVANAIEAFMGKACYGDADYVEVQDWLLRRIARESYLASVELAREKGAFPMYDRDHYLRSEFVATLDDDVQDAIARHGIRNSHLTSIAPTGTISLAADNTSSGIEPVFEYAFKRTVQKFEAPVVEEVTDYGQRELGVSGRRCEEVTPEQHVAVLANAYQHVDSAVSKTCNVPASTPWTDFKRIYERAWERGCKGCTTFQTEGKRAGVLVKKDEDKQADEAVVKDNGGACYIDWNTGRHECQ